MSGQPWLVNVANNPNINRDPPPAPLNAAPGAQVPVGHQQVVVEQQHAPVYGPPLQIGIGGPPIGFVPPLGAGIGIGAFPPVGLGVGAMDPFMFGGYGGGPLAPIRAGNFLPGAHAGIGFGLHGAGIPFPPPPPGAIAGVIAPFAPTVPLWQPGGLAFGNVPVGVGGVGIGGFIPPMMGNMMGAAAPMHMRPAPMCHDGNFGFPNQPAQQEPTQIAGGVPPGVTLVEAAEHSIIICIKGNVCPWLSPGAQFQVEAMQLASTTGLNRLIQVVNGVYDNAECENLALTECIELGNGLWEKGQTFKFNDAVSRVLTMKDAGWDNTRNRQGGNSLHLWGHRL